LVLLITLYGCCARAQDNYEIQVYGSDTVAAKNLMVEMHSNFTVKGSRAIPGSTYASDGTYPTTHAEHQTLELTYGLTPWMETGFYVFTSIQPDGGWQWVGDHIRPRVRVPESWHWPVGASLSTEVGYQRARFSPDTWTWEIRPILDKTFGRWYLAFNPALDRSFHGPSVHQGVTFSPNIKVGYDIRRWKSKGNDYQKSISAGIEYYGAEGSLDGFDTLRNQQQQLFPSIDLDVDPRLEFNFGVGVGATAATDHLIVKMILGRRFDFSPHPSSMHKGALDKRSAQR
jgi:hypothetical protein